MNTLDYNRSPLSASRIPSVVAWLVIGIIAIALPVLNHVGQRFAPEETTGGGPDIMFQMSGQYTLGAARAFPDHRNQFLSEFEAQAKTHSQRAAAAVLREVATTQPTTQPATLLSAQVDFVDTGDPLDAAAHPWYAKLRDPDTRDAAIKKADLVYVAVFVLLIAGLLVLAIGVALGVTAIILLVTRWLTLNLIRPAGRVGVYVEAFAIYLLRFFGGSVVLSLVMPHASLPLKVLPLCLPILFAAYWPVIRGTDWQTYRRDVGLHAGKGVFTEIGCGIVGYLACLPILAASMGVVVLLQRFSSEQASHPIVGEIVGTNPLWIFLLAAVFAPITEELMFRGLLLTHLRARFGMFASAVISGLIFAAIHPQGWLAIPTLLTIACILSLLREWRGSLIAPITAHAMNNGVVVLMLVLLSRI